MSETDQLRALLGRAEECLRAVLAFAILDGALRATDSLVRDAQATIAEMEKLPQLFRPCPHPSRQPDGRHEEYVASGGKVCRACGARGALRVNAEIVRVASENLGDLTGTKFGERLARHAEKSMRTKQKGRP